MSSVVLDIPTRQEIQLSVPAAAEIPVAISLYDLLHNSLILRHVAPYLPIASLLHLAAASRYFRHLILQTPGVFRHLDLSRVQSLQPEYRRIRPDDSITEDDFYSGPLRAGFSHLRRLNVLQNVQTLILDGLCVTSELCHEIINSPSFNVRILSIRGVKSLNEGKLMQTLQYACRPTRPAGSPRLEALYVFGAKDQAGVLAPVDVAGDAWWDARGHVVPRPVSKDWASCMLACQDVIAFDAVLCRGPRHRNSPAHDPFDTHAGHADSSPSVAVFGLSPCDGCGDAPEGPVHSRSGPSRSRPLLSPAPLLSSTLRAATSPETPDCAMVGRCLECIRERFCTVCVKWWCESCYRLPGQGLAGAAAQILVFDDDVATSPADDPDSSDSEAPASPKTKFQK
ncbi:hypothetical protein ESCO_005646 [Escovopsis weberi]|uniref:F-box domain-containing protein n=1 Tax=Escovopsis weberi TaxID=150374 RepID=A0A0M9VUJ5_ESCWE|nr:hypothetical protein ESCO_005646 [Escovopsis weberi]